MNPKQRHVDTVHKGDVLVQFVTIDHVQAKEPLRLYIMLARKKENLQMLCHQYPSLTSCPLAALNVHNQKQHQLLIVRHQTKQTFSLILLKVK
jgi:hypothetical protein